MEKNNKPILSWTSHPFVDFPQNSVMLMIFLAVFGYIFWRVTVIAWEMPLYYYIGIFILLGSMTTYFIPTRYEFYEYKILVWYAGIKIEKRYSDFKCYYADKKGVMLGTFMRPRRLDSFRGQSLRYSKTKKEKEQLLELLEQKIGNRK
jgi:hypothetical protein